jgi:hypothetical protein
VPFIFISVEKLIREDTNKLDKGFNFKSKLLKLRNFHLKYRWKTYLCLLFLLVFFCLIGLNFFTANNYLRTLNLEFAIDKIKRAHYLKDLFRSEHISDPSVNSALNKKIKKLFCADFKHFNNV